MSEISSDKFYPTTREGDKKSALRMNKMSGKLYSKARLKLPSLMAMFPLEPVPLSKVMAFPKLSQFRTTTG